MSNVCKAAVLGLGFCGWVCILASTCFNQNKVGSNTLNYPVDWAGAYNARTSAVASINWQTLGMNSLSYAWWIVCFQLFMLVLGAVSLVKPAMRIGVTAMFAVLTTSTFLFTSNMYNAPNGIFSFSHDQAMKIVVPTADNIGAGPYSFYKGLALYFAGLIILDICNAIMVLIGPMGAQEAAKPEAVSGKEAEMTTTVAV